MKNSNPRLQISLNGKRKKGVTLNISIRLKSKDIEECKIESLSILQKMKSLGKERDVYIKSLSNPYKFLKGFRVCKSEDIGCEKIFRNNETIPQYNNGNKTFLCEKCSDHKNKLNQGKL